MKSTKLEKKTIGCAVVLKPKWHYANWNSNGPMPLILRYFAFSDVAKILKGRRA